MSDVRAKVTKAFPGVKDGEIYPTQFEVGAEVVGDLARVAIAEGWASAEKVAVAPPAPAQPPVVASPPAAAAPVTEEKVAVTVIPADWKSFKLPQLKALAETLSGAPVADAAAAKQIIESELARRG